MTKEEILEQYYKQIAFKRDKKKDGWTRPFNADDYRGSKLLRDLVDAKTGEVVAPAGRMNIDYVNVGPYIRNTLAADKNDSREGALVDIYRVMRPGEPPTTEAAEDLFNSLFFDGERYDLSAVGRVKMNLRMDMQDVGDEIRVLRKEDILAVVDTLTKLKDGIGSIDDIDNLGNRRVRSVGELMQNQYRIGLLRMERAIKERMQSVDIETQRLDLVVLRVNVLALKFVMFTQPIMAASVRLKRQKARTLVLLTRSQHMRA